MIRKIRQTSEFIVLESVVASGEQVKFSRSFQLRIINFFSSDSSKEGAEDLFIQTVNNDEFEKYKSGRFLYLNAWRNISDTPIGNNHLG